MKSIIFALLILITINATAQTYWQQHVATKIDVRLDDQQHFLHAREEMVYTNNSPDTLKSLYLHIWPNAYKNDHTPFAEQQERNGNTVFYYSKARDKGYIDSLDFVVDGQSVEFFIAENTSDIARLDLTKPLLPGQKIKIATPFRVKIPDIVSRLGHNEQSYFISQWFPKPAVYDSRGWHAFSYLDQGEFYSEFGSYDVSMTTPRNYVVMATGNCTDESENKWLDSLANIPLPAKEPNEDEEIESSAEFKTVHYHEDNVHDFAWFADKRWVVRKDSVVSPGTDKVVYTWAAYLPSYKTVWADANKYLAQTVKSYGKWVGPYPYKTIKAVLGDMKAGDGMEYPTITIISKTALINFKAAAVHEAGHNWFYGMLGSNERDHAWMDEGMNTFYEKRTMKTLPGDSTIMHKVSSLNEELLYYDLAATHNDQAIDQPADNFTKLNYGIDVYYKSWLMLRMLEQYMGVDSFDRGMQYYYQQWHFKHPYPEDFRACMQKNTSKSLDWFFDGMFSTTKKIDFTITNARTGTNSTEITVRNNSGLLCPVMIEAYRGDSLLTEGWTAPFTHTTNITLPVTDWTKLKIDNIAPDAKSANDVYRRYGLSHRFGFKLKPVLGLNLSEKYEAFIGPAVAYNQYDGIMAGILFHNLTMPENRFRFILAPMYSFESNGFVGAGSVGYVWYPEHRFKDIQLQVDAKTFHNNETLVNLSNPLYSRFTKVAPSLLFTLKEHEATSTVTRTFMLKGYHITEDGFAYGINSMSNPETKIVAQKKMYGLVRYKHANDRTFNPFDFNVEGQLGADFAKISAEGHARVDYNTRKKSLYVRGYIGKFFAISNDPATYDRYKLNASFSGVNDYLYDGTYVGRNATSKLAAQQISLQEGGFKVPLHSAVNRSDNWLASINLETDLPLGRWPIRVFLDAGLIPNFTPTIANNKTTTLLYDAGVSVHLIKDVVNLYVPIVMSSDFQNYLKNTYGNKNAFARGISFTLQFQNINWLRSPTSALKMVVN